MFGIGGGCGGSRRPQSYTLLFSAFAVLLLLCGLFSSVSAKAEATLEEREALKTKKEG